MLCSDIIKILEEHSPLEYASSWDNVGLLIGDKKNPIHKIHIALDATDEVIEEAIQQNADMLLTHHPLIFQGMKKVVANDFIGRRIIRLIQSNINYYAMHTNFDIKGMADLAIDYLGIEKEDILEITYQSEQNVEGFGRVGHLSKTVSLKECCSLVKEKFQIDSVKVFGDLEKKVNKIAISPGSGKSMIPHALEKKADVLITGDIDHHDGIDAVARGLSIIDAGHYGIEYIFIPYMKKYLEQNLTDNVTVTCARIQNPFQII
ncbi:Nif3-like dinuclear metal center hexameric protein [Anaerosacchariphilus polymeriproducens]|uniref:GTP cyclohydrolase 1 type 2 homolog n=1 Tax=Anaerosacchariphilus polymeriproducens TaxID=1812858 RepID=A0A371AXQ2_9FIRM|nr:Nif3-like dinuclear metal center hexameric protein [Anaerosacchariphilus polymeriproducens]RDU24339.1 Nif3-like dinuclear metal center hexameric protein [Anaerosacchariphilus polymeriproducens]